MNQVESMPVTDNIISEPHILMFRRRLPGTQQPESAAATGAGAVTVG